MRDTHFFVPFGRFGGAAGVRKSQFSGWVGGCPRLGPRASWPRCNMISILVGLWWKLVTWRPSSTWVATFLVNPAMWHIIMANQSWENISERWHFVVNPPSTRVPFSDTIFWTHNHFIRRRMPTETVGPNDGIHERHAFCHPGVWTSYPWRVHSIMRKVKRGWLRQGHFNINWPTFASILACTCSPAFCYTFCSTFDGSCTCSTILPVFLPPLLITQSTLRGTFNFHWNKLEGLS